MSEHGGARGQYLTLLHITERDNLLKVVAELVQHLKRGHFGSMDLELLSHLIHEGRCFKYLV